MKSIFFILGVVSFYLMASASVVAKSPVRKPNLILIITDEHNFRTLGCYRDQLPEDEAYMWGETAVETPHIDWLAKNGAIFTSMYASSPVCSPSRSSMFTGEYPQRVNMPQNNLVLDTRVPTLADVLSQEGYATGYVGKWHLSGESKPGWQPAYSYGFQDNRFMFNRGHWKKMGFNEKDGSPRVASVNKNGEPNSNVNGADEKSFTTDWLTDRSIEFIDQHKEQPFFCVLSIPDPHTPNTVRAPYDTMYTGIHYDMPKSFYSPVSAGDPGWRKPDGKAIGMQKMIAQYFGMVKCIDDNVGRLIEELRKNDLLDHSIVVFASDHGDLLGEHKRVNKGVPLEASARIPFVVYYPPLIQSGTVVPQAANTTDWMETFLTLMNVKRIPQTTGRDLTPLLKQETLEHWDDITFSRFQKWAAAITDRYKLVVEGGNEPWLVDLEKDPDELTNVVNVHSYKEVAKHLAGKLMAYGQQNNDPNVLNPAVLNQLKALMEEK